MAFLPLVGHEADHRVFVGRNLALARTALGKRQTEWRTQYRLGSASKLSSWESGKNYPNPWFLLQLCNDYGFTMDWFFRGVRAGVPGGLADDLRRVEAEKPAAWPATAGPATAVAMKRPSPKS